MLNELKKNRQLYFMCIPGLLILLLFAYIPMVGIWMAFTNYNVRDGIFGSEFVGLQHIIQFFTTSTGMGMKVLKNTLVINFWGIILGTIVPIMIAICFNEIRGKIYKKFTQSVIFFPYFLSWVVVGAIIYAFFATSNGAINGMLESLGLETVRWYAEPKYWKPIIIFANVWKWCGYNSIIYMAAMASFDKSLFEAAAVDGASRFAQIRYITVPLLIPTVVILTLMSIGRIFFGDFGMIYGIVGNNALLYEEVAVIDTYVYSAMKSLGFSYTTAIGLFQSIMGLIMVSGSNKLAKKYTGEGLF